MSTVNETTAYKYIVIGYGESDIPVSNLVESDAELLDAILSCIYSNPADVADDERAEYQQTIDDPDEWCRGDGRNKLEITFEIGGIDVWRIAE